MVPVYLFFRPRRGFIWLAFLLAAISLKCRQHSVRAQPAERVPSIDPTHYQPTASPCYDEQGLPQRCVPDFINAAFNLEVEVTNTCGVRRPTRFCIQTGHMGVKKDCDICDARVPAYSHPANYLTDFNNPNNETWWQSETMADGIQYPHTVNLTLRLGKAYDITYVRLKFVSPRPESFVIYKKTHDEDEWIPWQYYSGSCRSTFQMSEKSPILPINEAVAQCTREFSDISPLTGGNIAFSTLEGRPSAENFEESEVLQEWVTTTEIKIVLVRMNTFGDEIFHDLRVLSSYFYAISDFAVGGRCKCNGHANQCVKSTGTGEYQLVCDCQHHTRGVDCQQCEPFYVDRPWRPATSTEANECLPCNCNNLSNRCFFDEKLFERTGHGGHCIDCAGNTQGEHCEHCIPNHWRRPGEHYCTACQCNEIGSVDGQCDDQGQCKCKPGVSGQRCDQCSPGFYDFSLGGCKDCRCDAAGSFNNLPNCSPVTGACVCKVNVEGQRCDKCKPGYFELSENNQYGCTLCFCFGHSSICSLAEGYYAVNVSSHFFEDTESWTGASEIRSEDVQWAQLDRAVAVSQLDDKPVYFYAPTKFLGDQRLAYNQLIGFTLRVQGNVAPSKQDIIIVGASGQELSLPIFAQSNPAPGLAEQNYRFRLHAMESQWSPSLREVDFISILSNVTAIKIRGTYSKGSVGFLSDFHIESASLTPYGEGDTHPADWVETCKCTEGFVGQFCESCAHGYKRTVKFGGPLTKCIKCDCHDHSESCDAESGVCICQHNTAGETCERCARGWYGDALVGTLDDCNKCDCPGDGPCILMDDGDTLCTECPEGYTGRKCEVCSEEFFGDPSNGLSCQKCNCNENTDPNAIGKCNTVSGECRRCIYHTTGFNCENCSPGFWGDALAEVKGDCKLCSCYSPGTVRPSSDYDVLECRQSDGQCNCQPNVIGKQCEMCQVGFFNLTSGAGCQSCECDPLGSLENGVCDVVSGQCRCKPGVTGRRCDMCASRHFGFGPEGCQPCNCDPTGSETLECDTFSGQCLCKTNIEGRRCDQCSENRYNLHAGCPMCDDCYALIQHRKNEINSSLSRYREQIDDIQNNPMPVDDAEFDDRVNIVRKDVAALHDKARLKMEGDDDSQIREKAEHMKGQLTDAERLVQSIQNQNFPQIDKNSGKVGDQLVRFGLEKDVTQKELDTEMAFVRTQAQLQLESAQESASRYGEKSQQLSDLAVEANRLAETQELRRKEVLSMAEQIVNLSRTALNDANEAIFGVSATGQHISSLINKVQEIKQRLENTNILIEKQSIETNRTYNEAAQMLSNVESVRLPNVVPGDLHSNAQEVSSEAAKLQNVKNKATKNEALLLEAEQTLREAFDQIQNAIVKQKHIDRSYDEVEALNTRAKAAFDLATKTWNEAKDTHDSLSDFSSKVDQSKQEALDELSQLPEIEKELNESESITQEAEAAVGDAKQNADQAFQLSTEAKLKAENLENESAKLGGITDQTNSEANARNEALHKLSTEIDSLVGTTRDFENQAVSDTEQSNDVLRRATLAESTAKSLQERLNTSERKLGSSLDQLNSLENIDDSQLAELERLIDEAERRYENSESERQMKEHIRKIELETAAEKRQIDALTKELENLHGIRDSLPKRCFNLISLEQEGQRRR